MTNAELKKRMNKKLYNSSDVVGILKQLGVIKTEVVHCKDCKYFYEKQEECPFKWKDLLNDNDFCSYGERKEPS